jgi:hypothetical protein
MKSCFGKVAAMFVFCTIGMLALASRSAKADDSPVCSVALASLVQGINKDWTAVLRISNSSKDTLFVADMVSSASLTIVAQERVGGRTVETSELFELGGRGRTRTPTGFASYVSLAPMPSKENRTGGSTVGVRNTFDLEITDVSNTNAEQIASWLAKWATNESATLKISVRVWILRAEEKAAIAEREIEVDSNQKPATVRVSSLSDQKLPGRIVPLGNLDAFASPQYAVVASSRTAGDAQWSKVVDALKTKHSAHVITYDKHPDETLAELKAIMPRHIAFIATPKEATREYVAAVHRLTRKLDDDPYTDALWGIVTGFDAENALNIVQTREPLLVKKVAAGTDIELAACTEGLWYCELKKNRMVRKLPGGAAVEERGPDDTTEALARALSDYQADLFVTSGHATERDWQIGFAYRNGSFRSKAGKLFGHPTASANAGKAFEIKSDNPKVYLAVGNCLMDHIDSPDAMALAWLNSAGVRQMAGYTVLTWYGYAGWGMLDYYVEQPGRFNMAEAFFANQQALLHRLETEFPEVARENPEPGKTRGRGDAAGLLHDRDVLAFYGDPKWDARFAAGPMRWKQSLTEHDGKWTLTITPKAGADTFNPVNKNGSQRGGRPIVALLPRRISGKVEIESGAELKPVITDDFVLVPLPVGVVREKYEVVFREVK